MTVLRGVLVGAVAIGSGQCRTREGELWSSLYRHPEDNTNRLTATTAIFVQEERHTPPGGACVSKRALLVGAALTTSSLSTAAASEAESISPRQAQWAERVAAAMEAGPVPTDVGDLVLEGGSSGGGGFFQAGPFKTARVERQRHTCSSCFPNCVGDECLLRVNVTYPRNFLEVSGACSLRSIKSSCRTGRDNSSGIHAEN